MNYEMEELVPVVMLQAKKFTGFESTSVTYENAQRLMEGVQYCINEYENASENALAGQKLSALESFELGKKIVKEKTVEVQELYNTMMDYFVSFGIKDLDMSVYEEIPRFLKIYDTEFFPQEEIIDMFYTVSVDMSGKSGVDAVYSYLKGIDTEQRFINRLGVTYINDCLLRNYKNHEISVDSIISNVFPDIIARIILKKPLMDSKFTVEEFDTLNRVFGNLDKDAIKENLDTLVDTIVNHLFDNDGEIKEYLGHETEDLAFRLSNTSYPSRVLIMQYKPM